MQHNELKCRILQCLETQSSDIKCSIKQWVPSRWTLIFYYPRNRKVLKWFIPEQISQNQGLRKQHKLFPSLFCVTYVFVYDEQCSSLNKRETNYFFSCLGFNDLNTKTSRESQNAALRTSLRLSNVSSCFYFYHYYTTLTITTVTVTTVTIN